MTLLDPPIRLAKQAVDEARAVNAARAESPRKSPAMFLAIFGAWALAIAWFAPRMWSLTDMATSTGALVSIVYFVIFAQIAWLYGFYNVGVVAFGALTARNAASTKAPTLRITGADAPAVAVLYTTCDDFVELSAESCVLLEYPNFHVYLDRKSVV